MLRFLFISLLAGACTDGFAQKKLLVGGNIGAATTYLSRNAQEFEGGGSTYGSLHLDYQLTSRLSINTQLQYQSEKYNSLFAGMFYQDVRLRTKRLLAGITEYLPIGNHALYTNLGLTLSNHSATANVFGSSNSNVKLLKEQGFKPWTMGWGIHVGYMFRFGLSLQTGFMGDLTPMYRGNDGRLRHSQFQLFQIGYMPGFHKREGIDRWSRKKKGR